MTEGTRIRLRRHAPASTGRWKHALRAAGAALTLAGTAPACAAANQTTGGPAQAEAPPPSDAQVAGALLATARAARPRRQVCGESPGGAEIVVCGADHGERWRVPSTTDSDPESPQATDTGLPAAPNVSSLPDCRHHCRGFGRAPAPLYVIDLRQLPPAPTGSDADRIAKGELSER